MRYSAFISLVFILSLAYSQTCSVRGDEIENRVKILASTYINAGFYHFFEEETSEFCLKNGIEILSITKPITFWKKNAYLIEYPEDFDINQLSDDEDFVSMREYDKINAIDYDGFFTFLYPKINYNFFDEFRSFLPAETAIIDVSLREGTLKSGDKIKIALFDDKREYKSNFWLWSQFYIYKVKIKGRITNIYLNNKLRGGFDSLYTYIKGTKKNSSTPVINISPGNALSTLFKLAEKITDQKYFNEIMNDIKYDAINVDYEELDILAENFDASEKRLFKDKIFNYPLISSNLYFSSKYSKNSGENSGEKKKTIFPPYIIKEVNGARIAFLGITDFSVLTDKPSLADRFEVSNDINKINEYVKEARHTSDILILLGQLKPEDTAMVVNSINADLYIGTKLGSEHKIENETIELKREQNEFQSPIEMKIIKNHVVGLDLALASEKGKIFLKRVESGYMNLLSNRVPRTKELSLILWNDFISYFKLAEEQKYLLPDPTKIWPQDEKGYKIKLDVWNFWNFVAAVLKSETESEIAFFEVTGLRSNSSGNISETYIKQWTENAGNIVTFNLPGSDVIRLAERVRNQAAFSNYKFVISGLDVPIKSYSPSMIKNIHPYKIHGRNIQPNEFYKVVSTDRLLEMNLLISEFTNTKSVKRNHTYRNMRIEVSPNKTDFLSLSNFITEFLNEKNKFYKDKIEERLFKELPRELSKLEKTSQNKQIKDLLKKITREKREAIERDIFKDYYNELRVLFDGNYVDSGPFFIFNYKNLSINYSDFNTHNSENFSSVQNSMINAYETSALSIESDCALTMYESRYSLEAGNRLKYGKTKTFIPQSTPVTNLPQNSLYTYTEFFGKFFDLPYYNLANKFGLFYELAHDTQIVEPENAERKNSLIMIPGLKIDGGTILKEVKAGPIADFDLSGVNSNTEFGLYSSVNASTFIFNRFNLLFDSEARYFFDTDEDDASDLGLEWYSKVKIRVPFIMNLFLTPFLDFLLYTGKVNNETGLSFNFGLALEFSTFLKPNL